MQATDSKRKVLLKTISILVIAFVVNVLFNMARGRGIREAIIGTLSEMKPFEVIVLGILLYLSFTGGLQRERVPLTSLNLKDKDGR